MMPAFSTRNSTWPDLASVTALVTSIVTVPSFGFGIRPLGPSTLPRRPTRPIMSGVAMTRSKSAAPLISTGSDGGLSSAIAEVEGRYLMRSTDGPLESAKIRCPRGHFFNGPVESLTVGERPDPAAEREAPD